jgi:alkylation response protein AidB-like acyl-CoA dehydrogenase
VISEELGRASAAVPFQCAVSLAAELLKRSESEHATELLPQLVAGEILITAGVVAPGQDWAASTLSVTKGLLSGHSQPLAFGAQAGFAILPAQADGQAALVLVDLSLSGVERRSLQSLDETMPFARLSFGEVSAVLLCQGHKAQQVMERVVNQSAILTAFEQIGGADAALELARNYALERHTFGRPIGSYQAVKHKLADMAVKIELARSNAFYGAWAMQAGDDTELALAAAACRLSASEAFEYAAEECLHLHGGIGYTWEADCHFYYKRARLLAATLGASGAWVDRLLGDASLKALHN